MDCAGKVKHNLSSHYLLYISIFNKLGKELKFWLHA